MAKKYILNEIICLCVYVHIHIYIHDIQFKWYIEIYHLKDMFNVYSIHYWIYALGQVSRKRGCKTDVCRKCIGKYLQDSWGSEGNRFVKEDSWTTAQLQLRSLTLEKFWSPEVPSELYCLKTRKLSLYTTTLSPINQSWQVCCSPPGALTLEGAALFGLWQFLEKELADSHQLLKVSVAGGISASALRKGSGGVLQHPLRSTFEVWKFTLSQKGYSRILGSHLS